MRGFGRTEHVLADIWDALVAVNTAQGKKAPTYPRPGAKKPKSSGLPFLSLLGRDLDNTSRG